MTRIITKDEEGLHLLSLLVRERLEQALETPGGRDLAERLKGSLKLAAGAMETRLTFDGRSIQLDQLTSPAQAGASGSLASFFAICQGKVRAIDVLRGQLKVTGNLLLLRRFLPILSFGAGDGQDER